MIYLLNKIEEFSQRFPNKTALITDQGEVTYSQLLENVNSIAAHLIQIVQPKNTIALHLPNCLELAYLYFACFKTDIIAIPMSIKLKSPEIQYLLERTKPKYFITHHLFCSELNAINWENTSVENIILIGQPQEYTRFSFISFNHLLTKIDSPIKTLPNLKDLAAVFFTSGSTGQPKGVEHTHASLTAMADNIADCADFTEHDRYLVSEAMTNASGCTHMNAALYQGGTAILASERTDTDIDYFIKTLRRYQPTVLSIMGKTNFDIVNYPTLSPHDFSTVRVNLTGGDKITKQLLHDFKAKTRVPLRQGYGMSEVLCITMNKSSDPSKLGSIGTETKDVKIRLLDKNGEKVAGGKPGEVWASGPNIMRGYWHDSELTKQVLVNGWLCTGDLAYRDQDGYYWFYGRVKQIIIREGANISPLEIEEVLTQHPAVKIAAAIGKADAEEGEVPVAFVIIKENKSATPQELMDFCFARLENFKVPVEIHIVNSLPLTKTNKVDRNQLKALISKN